MVEHDMLNLILETLSTDEEHMKNQIIHINAQLQYNQHMQNHFKLLSQTSNPTANKLAKSSRNKKKK